MALSQVPQSLLLVRPKHFSPNSETAGSNAFQNEGDEEAAAKALVEFDNLVKELRARRIKVFIVEDTDTPVKPDAIFPNNWFTTHHNGKFILYPMLSPKRRAERRRDVIGLLSESFEINEVVDLSSAEEEHQFLEGTGSIVFDHPNRVAYACHSPRTSEVLFRELCAKLNYDPILFHATDQLGKPIYHTNVMMWIGERVACICIDAIRDDQEQELVLDSINRTNHRIVAISFKQMESFAGNMLEVVNEYGKHFALMSTTAFDSLLPGQLAEIQKHVEPLPLPVPTIEAMGGGSVRCMVAGIHLPDKQVKQ